MFKIQKKTETTGFSIDKIICCSEDESRQKRYGEKPTTVALIDTPYECVYTDANDGTITLPVFGTVANTPIGIQCVGDISVWTSDINRSKSVHDLNEHVVFRDIRDPNGRRISTKKISRAIARYAKAIAIQNDLLASMSKVQAH